MNIVFIIIMVVGILLFAASYFVPSEEDETKSLSLQGNSVPEKETVTGTEGKNSGNKAVSGNAGESKSGTDAIEAAKKKAREAIQDDYKYDLHLTDSTNRTVEELEHDLLSGLNLDDNVPAETAGASTKTSGASKTAAAKTNSSKQNGSGKKGSGKKKNAPKNDRYDDLLYVDEESAASKDADKTVENVVKSTSSNSNKNTGNTNSNKSQSSKNGKKGKKK
ncbi:MAG: hypothetical protein K5879_01315 [Lachnospiraceae bacterium]|nr:hypothetical protein [Lachnospiraceae bacterium]